MDKTFVILTHLGSQPTRGLSPLFPVVCLQCASPPAFPANPVEWRPSATGHWESETLRLETNLTSGERADNSSNIPQPQSVTYVQLAATISGGTDTNGLIIFVGVAATLAYFVFTRFHRGAWGGIAAGGRYFMMVFFGATFAYTVMSRMALLIGRLEFLLGDWMRVL